MKILISLCLAGFVSLLWPSHSDLRLTLDTGGHLSNIRDMIINPVTGDIVTASDDKTIRIWDAETFQQKRKILGEIGDGCYGYNYAIALTPDARYLASAGFYKNHEIRVFDFKSGTLLQCLKAHTDVILDLDFSPDGRHLVSSSADSTVKVWKESGDGYSFLRSFHQHNSSVNAVKILNSDLFVSGGSDGRLVLYSMQTGPCQAFPHTSPVDVIAVSDQFIAACCDEFGILVFDFDLHVRKMIKIKDQLACSAFSPNGRYLLIGSHDKPYKCIVYDAENNFKKIKSYKKHNSGIETAAFLNDETAVSAGGTRKIIKVWDVQSGHDIGEMVGEGRTIWSVGIKDNVIAFGKVKDDLDDRGMSRFECAFNLLKMDATEPPLFDKGYRIMDEYDAYHLERSAGGPFNYSYAVLTLYQNNFPLWTFTRDEWNGYIHTCYGFSTGGIVLTGGFQGNLTAFNLDGDKLADFDGHSASIQSIAANDRFLVSAGDDQIIRIWDLTSISKYNGQPDTVYPILNLFVRNYEGVFESGKKHEWVIWTREGYYDCCEGASRFIGFHVNQGPGKEALFIEVEKLSDVLHRPDIIRSVLQGESIAEKDKSIDVRSILPLN